MKSPKLLAAIRENRERVDKAAKHETRAKPPESSTLFTGTVETPDEPQPPDNYIVSALPDCVGRADYVELLQHALQHGYSEDGQTVQLIRSQIDAIKGARKRGSRR